MVPLRFVDRDMLMRYHWGLAVGHVYAHHRSSTHAGVLWPRTRHQDTDTDTHDAPFMREDNHSEREVDVNAEIQADQYGTAPADARSEDDSISECGENTDGEGTGSGSSQNGSDRGSESNSGSDQALLDLEEMYGDTWYDEYED